MPIRNSHRDTPQVEEAERKVGAVLDELEQETDSDVKQVAIEELVDSDAQGRPLVKKAVDIRVERRARKAWSR